MSKSKSQMRRIKAQQGDELDPLEQERVMSDPRYAYDNEGAFIVDLHNPQPGGLGTELLIHEVVDLLNALEQRVEECVAWHEGDDSPRARLEQRVERLEGAIAINAHLFSSLSHTPVWNDEVPLHWRVAFAKIAILEYGENWKPPDDVMEALAEEGA